MPSQSRVEFLTRQSTMIVNSCSRFDQSYLSYIREQHREISSLPIFLLPGIQFHSNLFHHSRRVSFSSQLRIAVHTSYPVANHFLNFVVSPCKQSRFSVSFAARKNPSRRRLLGGRVNQDPKRDASIACKGLIGQHTFSADIGFTRETPTPALTVEVPRRQHLGGGWMYESESGRCAGGKISGRG